MISPRISFRCEDHVLQKLTCMALASFLFFAPPLTGQDGFSGYPDEAAEDAYIEEHPADLDEGMYDDGVRDVSILKSQEDGWQEDEADDNPYTVSGGLGVGSGFFAIDLNIGYAKTRYLSYDFGGHYLTVSGEEISKTVYGPEVGVRLSLPNPTMITPFIGTGGGYEKWERSERNVEFDDSGSATIIAFVGVNLNFTKRFGLQLMSKTTRYLQDPPLKRAGSPEREPSQINQVSLGFRIFL